MYILFYTLFLAVSLRTIEAVSPEYIPLRVENESRESLITTYFNLGLNYTEITAFLLLYHGIKISLRHLKRILRAKGLKRKGYCSPISDVIGSCREVEVVSVIDLCITG